MPIWSALYSHRIDEFPVQNVEMFIFTIDIYGFNNNNYNYVYPGYPHHVRVFQWGPASKLQSFTILIVNI